jgi:hypothetical protein
MESCWGVGMGKGRMFLFSSLPSSSSNLHVIGLPPWLSPCELTHE